MSFPRYPKYKDSGVEWLGEVPEHWEFKAIKKIVAVPVTDGPHETPHFVDEGVPFVSAEAVSTGRIDFSKVRACISPEDNKRYSLKYSPKLHDIYMVKSGATTGITAIVEDRTDFNIWSPLAAIRCGEKAVPHFVLNFMRSRNFLEAVTLNWSFGTQQNIGMKVIENLSCSLPPLEEQSQIAAFLDRETAKIDALVAEQERLIELLKEKRQAVICHAVTKGLNPDVRMKPSGIEWLGEVPEHWEVTSLRRVTSSVQTGGTPSSEPPSAELDEGVVWYTPGDFGDSLLLTTSARKISTKLVVSGEAKVFPPKSVLVVSIGATLGKVGFAKDASSGNQQINAVTPSAQIDGYFLAYSLSVKAEVMRFLSNASTIGIMNQEKTKEICLAVPPSTEQLDIISFLDAETAKLDMLVAEAQRAIDLLQERRTALISAAVTGQIDVRELVKVEAA